MTAGLRNLKKTWNNGQLNGICKYWDEKGNLEYEIAFNNGINKSPETVFLPIHYLFANQLYK